MLRTIKHYVTCKLKAQEERSNSHVTKDGHVDGSIVVRHFSLDVAKESIDHVQEEMVLMQCIETAQVPRIDLKKPAELLTDHRLESNLQHAARHRQGQRRHGAWHHFTDVGLGQVVFIRQDRCVKFVA